MSEIHLANKLVIPEKIRRLFKGGWEDSLEKVAIELPLGSAGQKTAPDFKFQILNERNKNPI